MKTKQAFQEWLIAQIAAELGVVVEEIDPCGSLDGLGVSSSQAVTLSGDLEDWLGRKLSPTLLWEYPTIDALAEYLASEANVSAAEASLPGKSFTLVPIQPEGAKPPFFCVSTLGGVVFPYFRLGPLVGTDQPLYGLQDPFLNDDCKPFETVEGLAAHYARVILDFWPTGPYMLGGYSYGGRVAFEVAQLIARNGSDVSLLVMMDSTAKGLGPFHGDGLLDSIRMGLNRMRHVFRLFRHGMPHLIDALSLMVRTAMYGRTGKKVSVMDYLKWAWADMLLKRTGMVNVLSRDSMAAMRIPSFRRIIHNLKLNAAAFSKHRPKPYPGKVILFRAVVQPPHNVDDQTLAWDEYAEGGVDIVPISGDHADHLAASIHEVARELTRCIDQFLCTKSSMRCTKLADVARSDRDSGM